jgi:hypothetical protein
VVAVHTAENTPDYVAFDGGAEGVANFIRTRSTPGSYHELVDSDSHINLVDWMDEAYHDGTGTNRHSWGLSFATRADVWPLAPQAWRDGAIDRGAARAAAYARWLRARSGIIIPTRRLTAAQARARVPGFVTHALLDPGRRSDPGREFPWEQFFNRYLRHLGGVAPVPVPPPSLAKESSMTLIFLTEQTRYLVVTPWGVKNITKEQGYAIDARNEGIQAWKLTNAEWDAIRFPA